MAARTDNPVEPTSREDDQVSSQPADETRYLTETGEAVGEDGSVVPIIGGLPAVEGSAWDIGAPVADRGANLADSNLADSNPADLSATTQPAGTVTAVSEPAAFVLFEATGDLASRMVLPAF